MPSNAVRKHKWGNRRPWEKAFYASKAWRQIRMWKLAKDPICQIRIKCQGAVATEVDHRIPLRFAPKLGLDPENLQSACKPCNLAKERLDKGKYRFQ